MQINNKKVVRTALLAVLVGALGYSFAAKSETKLLPFQGKLTDANGQVIEDKAIVVQFKMYDAPVGGNAKWNGEVQMLTVNGGLVNTTLGTKASLKNVDFSTPTYLEITIDANEDNQIGPEDPPLLPRQSIIPAVYAVEAGEAKNAQTLKGYDWSAVFTGGDPVSGKINGDKLANGSITTDQLKDGAVTATKIKAGSVKAAQVADGAITPAKLAKNSVTTEKIATNSITADKLDLSDAELNKLVGAIKEYLSKPVEGFDWTVSLGGGTCLEMIWCNPGTFKMGSPGTESGRGSDETQHDVELTKGFWLGTYEVTQAQWYAVLGTDPSYFKGSQRPVDCVKYNDALAFCRRLTEKERAAGHLPEGYEYTLPTEAQWEYACRADTTTALYNGKEFSASNLNELAWYGNGNGTGGNAGGVTHIVGQKKANAWGFYDMHGNVWEWCLDCCNWINVSVITDTYNDGIKDPLCTTGSNRVLRSGSWYDVVGDCRSASRAGGAPDFCRYDFGFRLALVPVK